VGGGGGCTYKNVVDKLPQFENKILAYFKLGGFVVAFSKFYHQEKNVRFRTLQIDACKIVFCNLTFMRSSVIRTTL